MWLHYGRPAVCEKLEFNLFENEATAQIGQVFVGYFCSAACAKCYVLRLSRDRAVLWEELSNEQKAQTFGSGGTSGRGRRTYWLWQELKQGKALEKTKERNVRALNGDIQQVIWQLKLGWFILGANWVLGEQDLDGTSFPLSALSLREWPASAPVSKLSHGVLDFTIKLTWWMSTGMYFNTADLRNFSTPRFLRRFF